MKPRRERKTKIVSGYCEKVEVEIRVSGLKTMQTKLRSRENLYGVE